MQLPRLRTGPLCYSLIEWAFRTCIYQAFIFIMLAVLFFYIPSLSEEMNETGKGFAIALGVIFCIPVLFCILLFVGLMKDNTTLLYIWVIYSLVGSVIFAILFIAGSILLFVEGEAVSGVVGLVVMIIIVGQMFYNTCIVNSIRMEIIEKRAAQTQDL